MARLQLSQTPGAPNPAVPQQGWAAEPQAGAMPGRGYGGQPRSGPVPGSWNRRARDYGDIPDSVEGAIADVAMGAAAQFLGRAIRKRVEQKVMPKIAAAAASREPMLREQIAIADKYPDICACLTDHVVFLAGRTGVLPMPNLQTLTLAQADGMVAQLGGSQAPPSYGLPAG